MSTAGYCPDFSVVGSTAKERYDSASTCPSFRVIGRFEAVSSKEADLVIIGMQHVHERHGVARTQEAQEVDPSVVALAAIWAYGLGENGRVHFRIGSHISKASQPLKVKDVTYPSYAQAATDDKVMGELLPGKIHIMIGQEDQDISPKDAAKTEIGRTVCRILAHYYAAPPSDDRAMSMRPANPTAVTIDQFPVQQAPTLALESALS